MCEQWDDNTDYKNVFVGPEKVRIKFRDYKKINKKNNIYLQ